MLTLAVLAPDVLPPSELEDAVKYLREDRELLESYRPVVDAAVSRALSSAKDELRSLGDLLGPDAQENFLTALENLSGDADATRAFIRTPAVEGVIGSILCVSFCWHRWVLAAPCATCLDSQYPFFGVSQVRGNL